MEQDEIKKLKERIKELEQLKEYRFLTNDIKKSLASCIQSNEEFNKNSKNELEAIKNLIKDLKINNEKWWQCSKCPITIMLYIVLSWFLITTSVDKYLCNHSDTSTTKTQSPIK